MYINNKHLFWTITLTLISLICVIFHFFLVDTKFALPNFLRFFLFAWFGVSLSMNPTQIDFLSSIKHSGNSNSNELNIKIAKWVSGIATGFNLFINLGFLLLK